MHQSHYKSGCPGPIAYHLCATPLTTDLDGKCGFVDKTGKMVIQPQFDYCWNFKDGMALVELDGKWGFIDKTGKLVIKAKFSSGIQKFSNGLARWDYPGGDKWRYIDKTGKVVFKP